MTALNVKLHEVDTLKLCKKCNEHKYFTEFRKHTNGKYHISTCRICENLKNKEYYNKNKEQLLNKCKLKNNNPNTFNERKNKTLLARYNITLNDYNKLFENQKGCCKICNKETIDLVVDHCHSTGKVRGLLCQPCNKGLGMFLDNRDNLLKAIEYLTND